MNHRNHIVLSMVAAIAIVAMSGCNSSGGGEKSTNNLVSHFQVNGGDGVIGGLSGEKGSITIESHDGNVSIKRSGEADTDFVVPNHTESLGDCPAILAESTIIGRDVPNQGKTASTLSLSTEFYADGTRLKRDVGGDGDVTNDCEVTGLKVADGVDVSIVSDEDDNYVQLSFDNDVIINGTLRGVPSPDIPEKKTKISLKSDQWIVVGEKGLIDARGTSDEDYRKPSIYLEIDNSSDGDRGMIIAGTLDASGIESDDGSQDGGYIYLDLYENEDLYVTGKVLSNGVAYNDNVGMGGYIHLYNYGGIFISGDLEAKGADGLSAGASGGMVEIETTEGESDDRERTVLFSGTIDVRGGSSTAERETLIVANDYHGGNGGYLEFYLDEGTDHDHQALGGTLIARGGDSKLGDAGRGGMVKLHFASVSTYPSVLSSAVDASGGDAPNGIGGDAGHVIIEYHNYNSTGGVMQMLGYESMEFHGGQGVLEGGAGGSLYIKHIYVDEAKHYSISSETDFYGYGGDAIDNETVEASGGVGGDGGYVDIQTKNTTVSIAGGIYLYGGDSWGDANNSDGGLITYCNQNGEWNLEDMTYNLDPGTGGSGTEGQEGSITENCSNDAAVDS